MILKILILINLVMLGLPACTSGQPITVEAAQTAVRLAWQANQHVVWEIDWPAAPIGGPLTVETWRADNRFRFEILESPAPALVGQTLVFDGQQAWRFNRFEPDLPLEPSSARLSPVSDAFAIVDRLATTAPIRTAQQASAELDHGPARKMTLTFENDNRLIFWIDRETGLPVRIMFSVEGNEATLRARRFEPLPEPSPGLFEPDQF